MVNHYCHIFVMAIYETIKKEYKNKALFVKIVPNEIKRVSSLENTFFNFKLTSQSALRSYRYKVKLPSVGFYYSLIRYQKENSPEILTSFLCYFLDPY